MDPVKMKAPMPQINSQSAHHPDVTDEDEAGATEHEFKETLNEETPADSDPEAVDTRKGKRRRRAASSGVITA